MNNYAGNEGSFGYSEATATWATRYVDPSGFECILTLQAETGSEVLRRAESALTHLVEAECKPLHKDSQNGNNKDNGKSSGKTVLVKSDGKNPTCPIHNIEMQKWTKNDRTWYSHRWNSGFCNGQKS
jgi:hypothetical protein